jgi:hypothetical protein
MVIHRRPVFSVILVVALLVSTLVLQVPVRAEDQTDDASRAFGLYAASSEDPYMPLDPDTLADIEGGRPLGVAGITRDVLVSADGSTMVQIEHENLTTIVVSDGVGGRERLRFQPGRSVYGQHISRDGTRLVTVGPMSCNPSGCSTAKWSVFDTRDGRLITSVEGDEHGYGLRSWVDPDAERLYQLTYDRGDESEGPWPIQIVAFDLTTGTEAGRLTVPGVLGGNWWTRSVDGALVGDVLMPAIALSPDGSRLAVVDAETDQLTMIDAATMTVEGTRSLARTEGMRHRFLTWLGIAPQTAEAKVSAGRWLDAVFAPSGDHLYLWGTESDIGDSIEDTEVHGLGLMLVDVESGEILGEALEGMMVQSVVSAPDDRTFYLTGTESPRSGHYSGVERLWRLDNQSLETLAERELQAFSQIAVLPPKLPMEGP